VLEREGVIDACRIPCFPVDTRGPTHSTKRRTLCVWARTACRGPPRPELPAWVLTLALPVGGGGLVLLACAVCAVRRYRRSSVRPDDDVDDHDTQILKLEAADANTIQLDAPQLEGVKARLRLQYS
jgi:hypothetical protein